MSPFFIREALPDDVEPILHLVNGAYRPALDAGGWTHESHLVVGPRVVREHVEQALQDSVVLVAKQAEAAVGCVHIQAARDEASIGMFAVWPHLQGRGLGKQLLARAEQYAQERGAKSFVLQVVESQVALIAFYERRGYARTGDYQPYPVDANVGAPLDPSIRLAVLRKNAVPR